MHEKKHPIDLFKIGDYPFFSLFLGYIWIEFTNPIIGFQFQIIPKVPNSAIALVFCYLTIPKSLKGIQLQYNPAIIALPFLIIATINLPFIEYGQHRSVVELISAWYWIILLIPLIVRVLATSSGRLHYLISSSIGLIILSIQYYIALYSSSFSVAGGEIEISRHHLSPSIVILLPIIIAYLFFHKGFLRYFLIVVLTAGLLAFIPSGARSAWLIVPIELVILALLGFRQKMIFTGAAIALAFIIVKPYINIDLIYSPEIIQHFETRTRKTREWQDDHTVWKRFGMLRKTQMILEEYPLMGIGYSNRSFASFDGGDVEFMGHIARVRQIDAHNTYLNLLAGTGLFGFIAFLYYMKVTYSVFMKIPATIRRRDDSIPFFVSLIGILMFEMVITTGITSIVRHTAIIYSLHAYYRNTAGDEPTSNLSIAYKQ